MRRVLAIALVLAACDDEPEIPGPSGETVEITLGSDGSGGLLFCEGDDCQSLPNPFECEQVDVEIDTATGEACGRCARSDGTEVTESCDGVLLSCTVVTAPDPDCVVCAYSNGAVLYSSCAADEPLECVSFSTSTGEPMADDFACAEDSDCPEGAFCLDGRCQADPAVGECQVCFGPNGNVILDECGAQCGAVGCPDVQCGEGFDRLIYPGECCPRCVPVSNCSSEVCPIPASIPECPDGTELIRDPQDCCGYLCVPSDCSRVDCAADIDEKRCPVGTELSFEFPNCCGTCVASDERPPCKSDDDCDPEELCTTSLGDCFQSCNADGACEDACFGRCRPLDVTCEDYVTPDPSTCDGDWVRSGRDDVGCPLPPVCVCPDGTESFDGACRSSCSNTECTSVPVCGPDERLEFGFPYCCGICVPADECLFAPRRCERDADCDSSALRCVEGFCASEDTVTCVVPQCRPGERIANGPGCCPICVPEERFCTESSECDDSERCTTELGECRLDPRCESDAAAGEPCTPDCFGICEPLP